MYREIVKDLMKWRNSDKRKPLVITGMRQCGKCNAKIWQGSF